MRSPVTGKLLAPSRTGQGVVQFNTPLSDDDFRRLSDWLGQYPDMALRAYGQINDLEFLRFFPSLRRFSYDPLYAGDSLTGLDYLDGSLEELEIGRTNARLDLAVLARFPRLRTLYLEGHSKHIDALSKLPDLEDLTLRSVTLPDLSPLLPLTRLRSLDIKLGGTKDLRLLPRIGQLRYLELWLVRGLSDIEAIGQLPSLRYLLLQALKHVVMLPDLSQDVALRRVHLETMKGLRDLRPLATAPGLEELLLVAMGHLSLDDLRPLTGLSRLRRITVGLGSEVRNAQARALFGLDDVEGPYDWRV